MGQAVQAAGFVVANPINRYAVWGEALRKSPDGSVDIYNWLPAPGAGDFNLMLRLYRPPRFSTAVGIHPVSTGLADPL